MQKPYWLFCKELMLPLSYPHYAFDFYGTLADIRTHEDDPMVWQKLCLFYGYYDALYQPEEMKKAYERLIAAKEAEKKDSLEDGPRYAHEACPEIDQTQVFQALFAEKGVTVDERLARYAGQFFRVLATEYLRLYDGTVEMLQELRRQGKKLYVLSNAQRIFTEYELHVLNIAQYFEGILISSDYGVRKPDSRFFQILLDQYQLSPKETLFIGNDSTTDIAGAKSVGMPTYYIHSNISPEGDCPQDSDFCEMDFTGWKIPRI